MIVSVKLSKKQVGQVLKDFDDTPASFTVRGCKCISCEVLRAIQKEVKHIVDYGRPKKKRAGK
jgi:hypothetical protein